MNNQRTIRRPVSTEGVGLHSGELVKLRLSPAAADTGILFRAPDGTLIPATIDHVVDSHFATTVGAFGVKVRTIEHLMAAASGLGIDNLLVDVSGGELPAMDGSSKPFVELLASAGRLTLPAARNSLVIDRTIRVEDGTRWIQVVPAESLRISYTLDHDHPAIGLQATSFDLSEEIFADEVAPARTYGFLRDVGAMRKNGLGLGGSLENAVVVGKRTVLNDALRFADEFVRHKILDLIGDLLLLGRPLVGHVIARNGGHALNHKLLVAINDALAAERRRSRARGNAPATAVRPSPESVAAL
jgi:UDP-3-O-acyl N-acetylglucosamine deacetylase